MLTLILASIVGCDIRQQTYGYAAPVYSYYAAPAKVVYQAVTPYAQPYQAPAQYESLVGRYLRDEQEYREKVAQSAKLDTLIQLMQRQQAPPQYQVVPQQPVYQQQPPPEKTLPSPQFQQPPPPSTQAPPPQPSSDVPPPPIAPTKPVPSFSSWSPASADQRVGVMVAVLRNRCTSCHGADNYQTKGKGHKLFEPDGSLSPDWPGEDSVRDEVVTDRMPRGKVKLSEQEKVAILTGLASLPGGPLASR